MKQYFTGFFTALCLATSFFLFIGANTGQNEFNKPIVIKGSQGFTYIDGDGIFIASDESKNVKVFFGLDKRDGGMIRLHNSSNKEMAYLGANNESGTLKLNNSNGFETCLISSEDNYGIINLFDRNGKLGYTESGQKN
jgi:hypothetical protein